MDIGNIINEYGNNHSPYVDRLVNHLPMAQWAVFKITNDLDKVEEYSNKFIKEHSLEDIDGYNKIDKNIKLTDCLGNRVMYEECCYIIEEMLKEKSLDDIVKEILNTYYLGISSGLYHPIIRLAYAVKGYEEYESMEKEVIRALSYFVTSYRESIVFNSYKPEYKCEDMSCVYKSEEVQNVISEQKTLGTRLKALYNNEYYIENGFIVTGNEDEKVYKLLLLFTKLFAKSNNIVLLHCITGIHAIELLKKYFEDYSKVIDVAATSMISHIVAADINFNEDINDDYDISWNYLLSKAIYAKDPHDIKLTYAVYELDKKYGVDRLKAIVSKRLKYVY